MDPLISVMLPTKNRYSSLKKALDSLAEQSFNKFELVVVDGGSTDGTKDLVLSYTKYFPVQWAEKSGGLIPQMNVAYKIAKGRYVVRTDDDVVFSKDWLKSIVETFEHSTEIGGVTGPTIIPEEYASCRDLFHYEDKMRTGNKLWRVLGKVYYDYFMEGAPYRISHWCKAGCFTLGTNYEKSLSGAVQDVDNLEACNWAVRKELLEKIGGYDTIYSGIGEYHEPDASFKIRNMGYRLVFNPKAMLNHCPSTEGFFKERPSSYPRMINFLTFYFRHIKPNTIDKIVRFASYVLFLNAYYVYQAFNKKQINQLGAIPGTIVGLAKGLLNRKIA